MYFHNTKLITPMFRVAGFGSLIWLWSFCLWAQTTQIHFLSGTDKDNLVQWDFWIDKGRKSGNWQKINVPSCWETEGFGTIAAVATASEQGIYKHQFIALPQWQGKHVRIVFEGVLSEATVKLNGKLLGSHRGAYEPFAFNVSDKLLWGASNELEIAVRKQQGASDSWSLGGIYKPVYLEILPPVHITQLLVDARQNGELQARILVNQPANTQVVAYLKDQHGRTIGEPLQSSAARFFSDQHIGFELNATFSGIQPWSAELPQRYRLTVELQNEHGALLHQLSTTVGFRSVVVQRNRLYLNNQPVQLQTVQYRGFWVESGISVSRQISELDGLLLKEMNANSVYQPLYTPDSHFLDVCDSLGLYLICQVPKALTELTLPVTNHPCLILLTDNTNQPDWVPQAVLPPNALHVVSEVSKLSDAFIKATWEATLKGNKWGMLLPYFAEESLKDENGKLLRQASTEQVGFVDAYHKPQALYHAVRDWWSPVQLRSEHSHGRFQGTLIAENRFSFTNLNQCRITWQLAKVIFPSDRTSTGDLQILASGIASSPNIAPGTADKLLLNLPNDWQNNDLLIVSIATSLGNEICTKHFPITSPENYLPQWWLGEFTNSSLVHKTETGWELSNEELKIIVHPHGHLLQINSPTQNHQIIGGVPIGEQPVEVRKEAEGTLLFRFAASSPVQWISYALSDAGVLRIQYAGKQVGFLFNGNLQVFSAYAVGLPSAGITAGASLNLIRQKNARWQGNYQQLYWAKWQTDNYSLTIMAGSSDVLMQMLAESHLLIAPSAQLPAPVTLYLKTEN
ncbi:MAG: glycoside hydrolase family 2 TIM barrel-domain containing protein [Cytophagales bacterium]|nr:hypothetical protein [Bernardetiaceae bacterium]MDW8204862.1 glycoside hydrolase family 2 TIM barrel-domain containing protein [Cytophagales bacterium]